MMNGGLTGHSAVHSYLLVSKGPHLLFHRLKSGLGDL
jgi:hypothetical protein